MRIDAHQHFWDPARGDYGWLTPADTKLYRRFAPADLAPHLATHGIHGTILVQAAPTEAETAALLALADATPFVLGVVGWVDFDAPDCADRIARFAAHPKAVGLRPMLQDIPEPDWIGAPSRRPALEAMVTHRLVFDALVRPDGMPAIAKLARRYPELTIILDHCGKPHVADAPEASWLASLNEIAATPNTACKLSGLLTEFPGNASDADLQPYVDAVLASFGPDRVLWGSDWPVLLLSSDYPAWSDMTERLLAGCDGNAHAAIRGGNARRLYRLETRS